MGHRLPSYNGLCSSPHGHNMLVEIEVKAVSTGFLDFKVVDRKLEQVTSPFDHAMVLDEGDPLLMVLNGMGFRTVEFSCEPTTEALAIYFFQMMASSQWKVLRCTVYETDKYSATVLAE